jgi:hypothetical protein
LKLVLEPWDLPLGLAVRHALQLSLLHSKPRRRMSKSQNDTSLEKTCREYKALPIFEEHALHGTGCRTYQNLLQSYQRCLIGKVFKPNVGHCPNTWYQAPQTLPATSLPVEPLKRAGVAAESTWHALVATREPTQCRQPNPASPSMHPYVILRYMCRNAHASHLFCRDASRRCKDCLAGFGLRRRGFPCVGHGSEVVIRLRPAAVPKHDQVSIRRRPREKDGRENQGCPLLPACGLVP